MCNLNILIKTVSSNPRTFTKFLKNVTHNSFQLNRDGDGIYFSGTDFLIRSQNKIKINRFVQDVQSSPFIISHQRIATSGFSSAYTQPFASEEFVLAHNGIMNDFIEQGTKHSDTFSFFNRFLEEVKKHNGTREFKIVKAVQTILDEKGGSFSISIFDKLEQCMYYFKNFSTTIHIYKSLQSDVLYMTTAWDNDKYLNRLNRTWIDKEIVDCTIYKIRISQKDKISIRKVGVIKEPPVETSHAPGWCQHSTTYSDCRSLPPEDVRYHQLQIEVPCLYCETLTTWINVTGYPICKTCQAKDFDDWDMSGVERVATPQYSHEPSAAWAKLADEMDELNEKNEKGDLTRDEQERLRELWLELNSIDGDIEDIETYGSR